jgi:soluble lytic murein transglycosylase-like protein
MSPPPQSQPVDSPYAPLVPVWAGDAGMPFARAVQRAANYYQLPQPLVWAVIKAESNFRMDAQSPAGAQGLMQLMPGTADAMGVADSFDPDQNIKAHHDNLCLVSFRHYRINKEVCRGFSKYWC